MGPLNIDASTLFFVKREYLMRLARFVGLNPHGLSTRALVLGLLFRVNKAKE